MDGIKAPLGGSLRINPLTHAASLSHLDVSTQADIIHLATSYESEDENMGRRHQRGGGAGGSLSGGSLGGSGRRGTPTTMYSKQEFREQYCITSKQLDLFELERSRKEKFFGCLSHYNIESPCSRSTSRSSLLSVCVRRRVPSDENLNTDYAPIQRYPRYPPPTQPPDELYQYDEDLECSYFRRRPKSVCGQPDPKKYTWMPEDEDSTKLERPRPVRIEDDFDGRRPPSRQSTMSGGSGMQYMSYSTEYLSTPQHRMYQCPAHPDVPPPPPPPPPALVQDGAPHRTKHVSFARSHTLTSFEDAAASNLSVQRRIRMRDGTERLLDGRKKPDGMQSPGQPLQQQPLPGTGLQQVVMPMSQQPFTSPYPQVIPQIAQNFPSQISVGHFPQGQVFPLNGPVPVHGQIHPALVGSFTPQHMVNMHAQHHVPSSQALAVQQEDSTKVVVLEKIKRGPMKTQATQTEVCLGRKPLPPNYLSLSPRTAKRVKMVAQGVQTNGGLNGNGKKLLKSFSEMGSGKFEQITNQVSPVSSVTYQHQSSFSFSESENEHDKLQRTQSEEPRSPRSMTTPTRGIATPPPVRSMSTPPPRTIATPPETTPKKQVTLVEEPIIQYPSISTLPRNSSHQHSATFPRRQSTPNMDITRLTRDQSQEYFRKNFQFIHTDERDDTIDELSIVEDMQKIQHSMELNQKNLDYLQQKIAQQQMMKVEHPPILKTSISVTLPSSVANTCTAGQLSKTSTLQSENSVSTETSHTTTTTDTEKLEKEIFIDFEPQVDADSPLVLRKAKKRMLQKTLSEGEILLDRRRQEIIKSSVDKDNMKDAPLVMSTSHENVKTTSDYEFGNHYDYYQHTPIKDEDIFKQPLNGNGIYSSTGALPTQESIDEEFHENIVCYKKGMFRKRSISLEEGSSTACSDGQENIANCHDGRTKSTPTSPQSDNDKGHQQKRSKKGPINHDEGDSVVPTSCLVPDQKVSPFASSDSLTADITSPRCSNEDSYFSCRDHSDGIWNESQATVLQIDSGTENGTAISTSDMSSLTASPGSLSLLTPNSRRKHLLLLQHQQRSSMDTDALDDELDHNQAQSPSSPRMKLELPGSHSVAQKQQLVSPVSSANKSIAPIPATKQTAPTILKQSPNRNIHTPSIAITKYDQSIDLPDSALKRNICGSVTKRRERALSPSRRRELQRKSPTNDRKTPDLTPSHTPHRSLDSPENGVSKGSNSVVPDLLLARTDSGKTNMTDVSESTTTTTTDEYITANSDSSKKSGSCKNANQAPESKNHEGSSFESASSIYSLARVEAIQDDMIVPSFSPPLSVHTRHIERVTNNMTNIFPANCSASSPPDAAPTISRPPQATPPPEDTSIKSDRIKKKATTVSPNVSKIQVKEPPSPTASSSSSGSYSLKVNVQGSGEKASSKSERKVKKNEVEEDTEIEVVQRQPVECPTPEQTVPTIKGESVSDDENSAHYSSSGYYESPVDEDEDDGGLTYKHSTKYKSSNRTWTADERRRKRKNFTLDFTRQQTDNASQSQENWGRRSSLVNEAISHTKSPMAQEKLFEEKTTPIGYSKKAFSDKSKNISSPKDGEKSRDRDFEIKRAAERERFMKKKSKSRSPVQSRGKDLTPGHLRGQGLLVDTLRRQEIGSKNGKVQLNVLTSDDSSEQYRAEVSGTNGSISPRRHRRLRESPRRKTGNSAKSPTSAFCTGSSSHRIRKKSGSNESVSLPGSLPRRRSSIQPSKIISSLEAEDIETSLTSAGYRLSPLNYIKPNGDSSGRQRIHKKANADTNKPKAMSAESLRSVSPGSDSVFYSEAADLSGTGATSSGGPSAAQEQRSVHCHHCGKQVDIITAEDASSPHFKGAYRDEQPDIVQPPAGFADSPNGVRPLTKQPGSRLYKKLEKRFRSEERQHAERRHHLRYRQDVRAKSEERGKDEHEIHDMRPMARSTGTSLDRLRAAESSPNMDVDDVDDPESDYGIYAESYKGNVWIYIGDNEEMTAWQRPDREDDRSQDGDENDDSRKDSTESEHEFRKKYQAITHRMVHRKSCIEMYRRQSSNTFAKENSANYYNQQQQLSLKKSLEEIFKLMLMVWCRENHAIKIISTEPSESDKTVIVRRQSGEFGFRIHGSKPVVVSAIEPDTPAETSGLEIGDIVIAVNGINVLDKSHSEVVKIAHAGSDTLELEVARTCDVVASLAGDACAPALYSGYLWKQGGHASGNQQAPWTRRWFCLKRDNCIYYYKSDSDTQPVGALMLINYKVIRTTCPDQSNRSFSFRVARDPIPGLHLAGDNEEATTRWIAVISHAIEKCSQRDNWLDSTIRNMKLTPSQVQRPDCFGYLMKLGNKWKCWTKRYCVLKDACLYFYQDGSSKSAFGMACLHGYRVQQSNTGGKKYAFEVMPPEPKQKHFYFHTESEMDKKRWVAALEYSIDRWMKAG